jgi:hypothetical protein
MGMFSVGEMIDRVVNSWQAGFVIADLRVFVIAGMAHYMNSSLRRRKE